MNKNAFKLHRELELIKIDLQLKNFEKGTSDFKELFAELELTAGASVSVVKGCLEQMNYGAAVDELKNIQKVIADELLQFRCDKRWYELESTGDDKIKFCGDCRKHVYHVKDMYELEARSCAGQCVAIQFPVQEKVEGFRSGCLITDFEDEELMGLPF